jgi:hypothetical protein
MAQLAEICRSIFGTNASLSVVGSSALGWYRVATGDLIGGMAGDASDLDLVLDVSRDVGVHTARRQEGDEVGGGYSQKILLALKAELIRRGGRYSVYLLY